MTMEALFNNVDNAISQFEQASSQEELCAELIENAQRDYYRYSEQASATEDASEQRAALERARAEAMRMKEYQIQMQQAQAAKIQAQRYLVSTRSELMNVIHSIEEKLPKFDQSISTFEQMASNPFGASAANQLPRLRATRDEYQRNLNDASTLVTRIDSALTGGGTSPRKSLTL